MHTRRNGLRRSRRLSAVGVLGVVLVAGLGWTMTHPSKPGQTAKPGPGTSSGQVGQITSVQNAHYAYLVPRAGDGWTFDEKSVVYEQVRGLIKYGVTLKYAQTEITFTQQQMPADLKPRDSDKFKSFISGSKVMRSQKVGDGEVYFVTALENGVESRTGSDTIIYATDDILMFGRAKTLVRYDAWTQLLAAMQKRLPK